MFTNSTMTSLIKIPAATTTAPLLFKALNQAGYAKEVTQIHRATNAYGLGFYVVMMLLQSFSKNKSNKKDANDVTQDLRELKEGEYELDPKQLNYSKIEKAFSSIASKLERFYSCESETVDGILQPTQKGLDTCAKSCDGATSKMSEKMINTLHRSPKALGNGNLFTITKKENEEELPKFACVENKKKPGFLCECPRAPIFRITPEARLKIRDFEKGRSSPKDMAPFLPLIIIALAFSKSILLGIILLFTTAVWAPYLNNTAATKRKKLPIS